MKINKPYIIGIANEKENKAEDLKIPAFMIKIESIDNGIYKIRLYEPCAPNRAKVFMEWIRLSLCYSNSENVRRILISTIDIGIIACEEECFDAKLLNAEFNDLTEEICEDIILTIEKVN